MFSPYYAWARRTGPARPENFVSLNVALYGRGVRRWAMTERRELSLARTSNSLQIGPSCLRWDGSALTVDIEEVGMPLPRRVVGQVRLVSDTLNAVCFAIDGAGQHLWRPIAPLARADVRFESPRLNWSGQGYFDWNSGVVPLEDTFRHWDWSRSSDPDETHVLYDVTRKDGREGAIGVRFDAAGGSSIFDVPPRRPLPATSVWRIARATRIAADQKASIATTLEDTPFYARSVLKASSGKGVRHAVHESLDLTRFTMPIVQMMLPFRMPRRGR